MTWTGILRLIVSLLLIIIVLIQDSKEDANSALTGEKSGLFANAKARGFDLFMTITTTVIAVLFVTFSILDVAL